MLPYNKSLQPQSQLSPGVKSMNLPKLEESGAIILGVLFIIFGIRGIGFQE